MSEENEMSFLDHLEELRWHLIRAVGAIIVFTLIAFIWNSFFFGVIILGPSRPSFYTYTVLCDVAKWLSLPALCIEKLPFIIISREMTGQFTMSLMSSIFIGLVCAFPYAFWEIWRFVSPGLYHHERKMTKGATFFVSLLFMIGVTFGYFIVSPLAINFLANYQVDPSIVNQFDITSYVSTLVMMVLACGLMFQLPMVVYFLTRVGLITPSFMKEYRRHAIVVILVVGAVITPPDPFSQILVSTPVYLLYEISIYISAIVVKRMEREAHELELQTSSE